MSRSESLESARILARYRRLVLLGRLRLPLAPARRLVGPDCAYHLYHRHGGGDSAKTAFHEKLKRVRPRTRRR